MVCGNRDERTLRGVLKGRSRQVTPGRTEASPYEVCEDEAAALNADRCEADDQRESGSGRTDDGDGKPRNERHGAESVSLKGGVAARSTAAIHDWIAVGVTAESPRLVT